MVKNLFLFFMAKFMYKELNIKSLGYHGRTVAYEVISITDCNDLCNVYLYKIKELGTQEIKTFVSASDAHFISFGKEMVKISPGLMFCAKKIKRKQGRESVFNKYVLA